MAELAKGGILELSGLKTVSGLLTERLAGSAGAMVCISAGLTSPIPRMVVWLS